MTSSLLKILITGGNGQLAHAIASHPRSKDFQLIICSKNDLDITSSASVRNALAKYAPHIIINTAAYTAVDKAEEESDNAMQTNRLGSEKLAIACTEHHIPIIHLSTDYVFDGMQTIPYKESDPVHPVNLYGQSKWLGEQAIRQHCHQHVILRVSGVFSEHGKNFFNTMLRLNHQGTPIRVVADQITCPTYAGDIANALFTIAKQQTAWGTYHFCSTPPVSWHAFAEAILNKQLEAITTADYPTAAKRPAYSVLDCSKIEADYGIKQPSWQQAIWNMQ
jgi:dTDP-4-dehydrorhamnose reductase